MNQSPNSRFKFFPQLNERDGCRWLDSSNTFSSQLVEAHFKTTGLKYKFLQALGEARLLPIKEVLESFEFFARVRRSTKSQVVADLCCGHGLIGVLFAMFERSVERVLLADKAQPDSREKLLAVATEVAPWLKSKIENRGGKLQSDCDWIEPGASIVSSHACGILSDLCIEIAIKSGGPIAILPCCYPKSACEAPLALQNALGLAKAFDVDRTYRLEAAGYQVRWAEIPAAITPMNRIIYARRIS
ncbi:MAG: hypothetical protein ACI814_004334 [Mariniblastus sp.]|jgi:hypothetical protein